MTKMTKEAEKAKAEKTKETQETNETEKRDLRDPRWLKYLVVSFLSICSLITFYYTIQLSLCLLEKIYPLQYQTILGGYKFPRLIKVDGLDFWADLLQSFVILMVLGIGISVGYNTDNNIDNKWQKRGIIVLAGMFHLMSVLGVIRDYCSFKESGFWMDGVGCVAGVVLEVLGVGLSVWAFKNRDIRGPVKKVDC